LLFAAAAASTPVPQRRYTGPCRGSAKIELTRTDLFSVPDWKATEVSVLGFHLGMTLRQATEVARGQGLQLGDSEAGGACRGSICDVSREDVYVGVSLQFDASGKAIRVEVAVAPPFTEAVVKRASVVHEFKGKTLRFFSHYSEALRLRLLGRGVVEKRTGTSPRSPVAGVVYAYRSQGVELYVSRDKSSPHGIEDLSMSFVCPSHSPYY
jgi:hypothetical protein